MVVVALGVRVAVGLLARKLERAGEVPAVDAPTLREPVRPEPARVTDVPASLAVRAPVDGLRAVALRRPTTAFGAAAAVERLAAVRFAVVARFRPAVVRLAAVRVPAADDFVADDFVADDFVADDFVADDFVAGDFVADVLLAALLAAVRLVVDFGPAFAAEGLDARPAAVLEGELFTAALRVLVGLRELVDVVGFFAALVSLPVDALRLDTFKLPPRLSTASSSRE